MSQVYQYRVSRAQLLGTRSRQEDATSLSSTELFDEKGLLLVLADGMGGMADGHVFSRLVTEEMQRAFAAAPSTEDMQEVLACCFHAAQEKAVRLNRDAEDEGGATVVAVLIREDRCAFLCAGDSSLALVRNGGLIWLNRPQVMGVRLDENVALGYLSQADVQGNALRDAVIGYAGASAAFACDICTQPFRLIPGDRIALMSDGVTGTLGATELLPLLMLPRERAAKEIIRAVEQKNKPEQDNGSILLAVVE